MKHLQGAPEVFVSISVWLILTVVYCHLPFKPDDGVLRRTLALDSDWMRIPPLPHTSHLCCMNVGKIFIFWHPQSYRDKYEICASHPWPVRKASVLGTRAVRLYPLTWEKKKSFISFVLSLKKYYLPPPAPIFDFSCYNSTLTNKPSGFSVSLIPRKVVLERR